jgi:hypothetical protein
MAEQSSGKQPKTDNVQHPPTKTEDSAAHALPQNALAGFAAGPPGTGIDSDPHVQASMLADTRIQTAQRQALAVRIGRRFGNQYLQKVVAKVESNHRERVDDPGYRVTVVHPPVHPAVQRQDEEEETGPPEVMGILDGVSIATYRDLYGVYVRMVKRLLKALMKARREGARVPGFVNSVIRAGIANRDTLAGIDPSEAIDQVTYGEGYGWTEQYDQALDKIEDAKISQSAANMLKAHNAAAAALESIQDAMAKIRDAQSKAYMSEDSDLGAKILGMVFQANSLAEKIATAKQQTHQANSALANMVGQGLKCPKAVEYLHVFKAVAKIKEVFTAYSAAADLLSEGKSGMTKAVKSLKAVVDLAGVAGSLIPATKGLSVGLSPLQGEILNVTLKALAKLIEVARKINRDLIERGEYHLVKDYFVGNKSDIEKAASGGDEMPTEGWLWTEKVKATAMAEWVFGHRDNLWGIFYGSAEPGSNV